MALHLVDGALRARAVAYGLITGGFALVFTFVTVRLLIETEWLTGTAAAVFAAVFWRQVFRFYRRITAPPMFPDDVA